MGAQDTHEGTYIGMMEHNIRTLSNALGGIRNAFLSGNEYVDSTHTNAQTAYSDAQNGAHKSSL